MNKHWDTEEEKQQFFREMDKAIAILSFHFDAVWEVAQQDGLPGFHEVLQKLSCDDCNAKLLGRCLGGGYYTSGVLRCMESKDLQLQSSMN